MGIAFNKKDVFPIIGKIIDNELLINDSINRDEIIYKLLDNSEAKEFINLAIPKYKTNNKFHIAGNMVDWFSAEIKKQSDIALAWLNKYLITKTKVNGRKVSEYRLKEEFIFNEIMDELPKQLCEGAKRTITINIYERNIKARIECIKIYGANCICCGFNFYKKYGDIGQDFIHVHHIKPISEIKEEYKVNPKTDLRPVCPNCHAMIHSKTPPFTIEEIKNKIIKHNN